MSGADVFSRVVCGVDGSDAGLEAVRQARRLGGADARLVLVGVSEARLGVHAGMLAGQASDELDAQARGAIEAARAAAGEAETRLIRGRPEETLLQVTAEEHSTLVAVGSHETSRRRGIVLGSVATRLVHEAPCSVLVARAPADPEGFPGSIVVGVDGSAASLQAARVGEELGARLGVPVTLLAAGGAAEEVDTGELARSGLELTHVETKPVQALVEASTTAGLLIVASRGLRGLRALGSVSERAAHQSHCSVLVHRPPAP